MIRERAVGVDASRDDLTHRVRDDEVDPLEGGDDSLVGCREGRCLGREADVPTTARAGLVDEPQQDGERTVGPGRDRRAGRVELVEPAA